MAQTHELLLLQVELGLTLLTLVRRTHFCTGSLDLFGVLHILLGVDIDHGSVGTSLLKFDFAKFPELIQSR